MTLTPLQDDIITRADTLMEEVEPDVNGYKALQRHLVDIRTLGNLGNLSVSVAKRPERPSLTFTEFSGILGETPILLKPDFSVTYGDHAWILILDAEQLGALVERQFYEEACLQENQNPCRMALVIHHLERLEEEERKAVMEHVREVFPLVSEAAVMPVDDMLSEKLERWFSELKENAEQVMQDAIESRLLSMLEPTLTLCKTVEDRISTIPRPSVTQEDYRERQAEAQKLLMDVEQLENRVWPLLHQALQRHVSSLSDQNWSATRTIGEFVSSWINEDANALIRETLLKELGELLRHPSTFTRELSDLPDNPEAWFASPPHIELDVPLPVYEVTQDWIQLLGRALVGAALGFITPYPRFPRPLKALTGGFLAVGQYVARMKPVLSPQNSQRIDSQLRESVEHLMSCYSTSLRKEVSVRLNRSLAATEKIQEEEHRYEIDRQRITSQLRTARALLLKLEVLTTDIQPPLNIQGEFS